MKLALKIIVPLLFIGLALLLVKVLINAKRATPPRTPTEIVSVADVISVEIRDHQPPVISYGTVQSYFETDLVPQVNGRIDQVAESFRVGVLVKKGDVLVSIDDADYQAILAQQSSNLAAAKRSLAEETIKSEQAAGDWLASGRDLAKASDFVLRKPQLESARANIKSAQAALLKAETDIKRTVIRAPYDAVVMSRTASVGNYASQQESLGKVVATERAEIRLPLTAGQATRVELPGLGANRDGSPVKVRLKSANKKGVEWNGALVRVEPTIDPQNQVTYVIVEVEKPYAARSEPLVVGTFVNASIPARVISESCKVPEAALVNDRFVWALNKEDELCRVAAKRVHGHEGYVYLHLSNQDMERSELSAPLRIVTRPLANFKSDQKVKPLLQSQ